MIWDHRVRDADSCHSPNRSAVPANALVLASYGKTNPSLLRRRSPTITAESRADRRAQVGKQIKAEMCVAV